MTAKEHYVFTAPDDPHITIWRYMDFTKFVSMLENKGLYFSRSDKLGDPFEGSFSKENGRLRPEVYSDIPPNSLDIVYKLCENMRKFTYINCWHMNDFESAAMWKLYSKTNEAIAIKSGYQQLNECLDDESFLGIVHYEDYDNTWIPEGNTLYPYVHKRLSFSHEQELRAVIQKTPNNQMHLDIPPNQLITGVWKTVEIINLVNEIYVAPTSPSWFKILVEKILKRYGIAIKVNQSSLDQDPFF